MKKERGEREKANDYRKRKPPHLLMSHEKCSRVGKVVSRKSGSSRMSWLAEGGAVDLGGGRNRGTDTSNIGEHGKYTECFTTKEALKDNHCNNLAGCSCRSLRRRLDERRWK